MSGSKLEPLINIGCKVTVDFRSPLQDVQCQEDHLGGPVSLQMKTCIKQLLTADTP